jgi:hypothetical protein
MIARASTSTTADLSFVIAFSSSSRSVLAAAALVVPVVPIVSSCCCCLVVVTGNYFLCYFRRPYCSRLMAAALKDTHQLFI